MIDDIRKYRDAEPFTPFIVSMQDGRQFRVNDRFHVAMGGNLVVVYEEDADTFSRLSGKLIGKVFLDSAAGR